MLYIVDIMWRVMERTGRLEMVLCMMSTMCNGGVRGSYRKLVLLMCTDTNSMHCQCFCIICTIMTHYTLIPYVSVLVTIKITIDNLRSKMKESNLEKFFTECTLASGLLNIFIHFNRYTFWVKFNNRRR